MYQVDIITIMPQMIEPFISKSIIGIAQKKGIAKIQLHNLRDYTTYKHRQVDNYPYGGGAGMVLMPVPLGNAIDALQEKVTYDEIIYLSPDGDPMTQFTVNQLSLLKNIILICGRYKGIDERIRQHYVTKEISIGDYVITGGELAAAVVIDAVIRVLPGAIGDEESALSDSFQDNLLSAPLYTRPRTYKNMDVPKVLLGGNEKHIKEWRTEQATKRTTRRRPDMLS